MITTTHARPPAQLTARPLHLSTTICPRCFQTLNAAPGFRAKGETPGSHRCAPSPSEVLQPSAAVPFS